MQFREIKLQDFYKINEILSKTTYNGCEYSQVYLRGWKFFNFNSMQICIEEDTIWLRFVPHPELYKGRTIKGGYMYLPPLAVIENIVQAYDKLYDFCQAEGSDLVVINTPKEYVELLDESKYKFSFNRDQSEYLYLPKDLIELAGKKYHGKRNHIKKFLTLYSLSEDGKGYVFRDYQESDFEGVMGLFVEWQESKKFSDELYEDEVDELKLVKMALTRVIECPYCFADVIEYDSKIIGFSMGEISTSGVGITHIEKGDIAYQGIYPALCQMFAKKHFENVRLVNRQEDMGIEGLRKSKMSLYPVDFVDKYTVVQKN